MQPIIPSPFLCPVSLIAGMPIVQLPVRHILYFECCRIQQKILKSRYLARKKGNDDSFSILAFVFLFAFSMQFFLFFVSILALFLRENEINKNGNQAEYFGDTICECFSSLGLCLLLSCQICRIRILHREYRRNVMHIKFRDICEASSPLTQIELLLALQKEAIGGECVWIPNRCADEGRSSDDRSTYFLLSNR